MRLKRPNYGRNFLFGVVLVLLNCNIQWTVSFIPAKRHDVRKKESSLCIMKAFVCWFTFPFPHVLMFTFTKR